MTFDEIFNATLLKDNNIEVHVHKAYNSNFAKNFYLYCDEIRLCELKILDARETGHHFHYVLGDVPSLNIGSEYKIYDDRFLFCFLDMRVLMRNEKIASLFYCDDVMGANYHKYYTTFRLFSPLATSAFCVYTLEGKEHILTLEKNPDNGVFQGRAPGDLGKSNYYFIVRINGKLIMADDPYAKAVTSQSSCSVVVDDRKTYIDLNEDKLPTLKSPTDAIIYEMSIRDMTSFKGTSIVHKGQYLGLTQPSSKTKNNNPVGLDYLRYLGVTHVQLMPTYDFNTGSDIYPNEAYNWGYDPLFYNVPEGSYSSDSKDPYARIIEMKKMVASFHKAGIRVVMDVVFNHVFNMESSSFEKICPSYYFRYNENGSLSNGSFCGNEFNSSFPMARKFIVDSCLYWVKEYGIDGFRFDLMGLIDIDTINEVKTKCRQIKKDFLIYGEGWDMPTVLPSSMRSNSNNSQKLPHVGFFNDRFRDTVKGKSSDYELWVKGYLLGDTNYIDGFKHCFLSSSLPVSFPPMFQSPDQSINFVECHDNATVYDKLEVSNSYESEEIKLKRIRLLNAAVILSYGIPFLHMGQEIGYSKKGIYNSYNSGDEINQFNYDLLDQRINEAKFVKDLIFVKKAFNCFRLSSKEAIKQTVSFKDLPYGAIAISYVGEKVEPCKEMIIIFNPTNSSFDLELNDEFSLVMDINGFVTDDTKKRKYHIDGISFYILKSVLEKND